VEAWQRGVALFVGALLVLGAALNDEPRWAVLTVGLVLMGVVSVDQVTAFLKR